MKVTRETGHRFSAIRLRSINDPHQGSLPTVQTVKPLSRVARPGAAWSAREIESQALATLAALAQISTPSAAHFSGDSNLPSRTSALDGGTFIRSPRRRGLAASAASALSS